MGMTPSPSFPADEFDEWAETYDSSVAEDQFPFYGYTKVLEKTIEQSQVKPGMAVLDLGTGTGNLAALFAQMGCELCCTDFSEVMLYKARQKVPQAHFYWQDLRGGWPVEMRERFDRIVSAYVFHHFELDEKVRIVKDLIHLHLVSGGRLVIADISFPDRSAQGELKEKMGNGWEEEYYWIAAEAIPILEQEGLKVKYARASVCAGIFTFQA